MDRNDCIWFRWPLYYYGQESLRRTGLSLIVNKRVQNATGWNLKNDKIMLVCFQDKPFNITVIQVCASAPNAEEAEVEGSVETYKTF